MIQVLRLGHATFQTPDLDKAIEHYTQVIGLALAGRDGKRAFLANRIGQLSIELVEGSEAKCRKLAFEVAPDAELADLKKNLAGHGVEAEQRSDPVPGIAQALTFADPKGTEIELFNTWRTVGNNGQVAGVGVFKLGHIAFVVPDPKATAEFYATVLGFRVSDWIGDFFVFMRCNADHHSVNFITGKNVKMHHIAFELRDFSHLQSACDLFGQRNIPIIWGPVRLGPGHNIAAFHRDHDDWVVEFYTELDQMKDETLGYYEPRPWHRDRPQRPKVWDPKSSSIWGPPPTPDFFRNRD
jgi:catechol 2,3-dioxygenase-like lactoylglutathione lyase family enzyme